MGVNSVFLCLLLLSQLLLVVPMAMGRPAATEEEKKIVQFRFIISIFTQLPKSNNPSSPKEA
jgi:hypothetical protein